MKETSQSEGQAVAAGSSPTAGFLNTDWNPRSLPAGTTTANFALRTSDNAATTGSLYRAGRSDTVVCIMHPREFMACHYLVPDIVQAGFAAWSQSPRSVGNDLRLEHELALFDVAAGLGFLRQNGFKNIVLLGNSGGSGLYSLYIQQSALPPAERIARTPGGRPTRLDGLDMPEVQGLAYIAPHPGQAAVLLGCIDPSVANEADALSVDPSLDPLNPENGFVEPPGSSRYDPSFIKRYRDAQMRRVRRLDDVARTLIAERLAARKRGKESGSAADRRAGAHTPVMTIWRTDADLRCFDLSLDPSDRLYGSLWSSNPFSSNYGAVGFARVVSPEAWLSTWSVISSNALLSKTAPAVTQPTLLIEYTGDQACFPSDMRAIFASVRASDKRHERIRGDHHGRALTREEEPGRYAAGRLLQQWLRERF